MSVYVIRLAAHKRDARNGLLVFGVEKEKGLTLPVWTNRFAAEEFAESFGLKRGWYWISAEEREAGPLAKYRNDYPSVLLNAVLERDGEIVAEEVVPMSEALERVE